MTDQYQNWRERLSDSSLPVPTDIPQSGYYKMRRHKDAPWLPVAIWEVEGKQICRVASDTVDPISVWNSCAKHPIAKDLARAVFDTGQWPDMPNDAPMSNMPSDPYEALLAEIQDKMDQAQAWLDRHPKGAPDKTQADWARNVEAQIQDLLKRANNMHTSEKAPHLAASRDVDQRFSFRKDMDPVKKALKNAWGAFAAAEERRLRAEAEAKAAEERKRVEAERARIEAEQKKLMDEDPIAALTSDPEPMPELPKVEDVKVNVGGGVGSRGGLTTVWLADVEDYTKAAIHYARHSNVVDLIDRLATADAKAMKDNADIPGVRVYSERRAK